MQLWPPTFLSAKRPCTWSRTRLTQNFPSILVSECILFHGLRDHSFSQNGSWIGPGGQQLSRWSASGPVPGWSSTAVTAFGPTSIGFTTCTMPTLLGARSEEHTSELQSRLHLVCRLL